MTFRVESAEGFFDRPPQPAIAKALKALRDRRKRMAEATIAMTVSRNYELTVSDALWDAIKGMEPPEQVRTAMEHLTTRSKEVNVVDAQIGEWSVMTDDGSIQRIIHEGEGDTEFTDD